MASEITDTEREKIWVLADHNMRDMCEPSLNASVLISSWEHCSATHSSMGWDMKAKKKELFHTESRFIITYRSDKTTWDVDEIAGFTMFRFESEYGEKLLYW